MFINFYKNVEFNQSLIDRYAVDGYLSVSMTSEKIEIPKELLQALEVFQQKFRGMGKGKKYDNEQFIGKLKEHKDLLQQKVDLAVVTKQVFKQIE